MVAKPVTVGVVGVMVLASALVLNYFVLPGEETETATRATVPSAPDQASSQPDSSRPGTTRPAEPAGRPAASTPARPAEPAAAASAPARRDGPSTPSFDVVRVDPDGNTVIAGRGAPNTEIAILDDDREIGRVTTDDRGEWVFVPPSKLESGQRVLTLKELDADPLESAEAVVLVIPEKGPDIAGRPSDEASVPLAVVVPRDGAGAGQRAAAKVLQAPAAGRLASAEPGSATPGTGATGAERTGGTASGEAAPDAAKQDAPDRVSAAPGAPAAGRSDGAAPAEPAATAGDGGATPAAPAAGAVAGSAPSEVAKPDPARQLAVAPAVSAYPEASPATPGPAEAGQEDVAVDVIDYDDKGDVVFSGRADPGARVEVFIDDRKVGDAGADAEGRWTMRPAEPVAPGSYQLRVDKVAPTGTVEARVAFPFVRADPLTELPNDRLVVIQPGNNLWRIATRVYGSGFHYVEIFDANKDQILDPDLIYPGQVFGLPRVN